MNSKKVFKFLTLPAIMFILNKLFITKKSSLHLLAKELNISYSYVWLISQYMLDKGWAKKVNKGREVDFLITDEGIKVATVINKLFVILGVTDLNITDFQRILPKEDKQ